MKFGELVAWIPPEAIETLRESDDPDDRALLPRIDYREREAPGPPSTMGCLEGLLRTVR